MKIVRTLTDLEGVTDMFVKAICVKCGDTYTSLIDNARQVVTKGCVICTTDWEPTGAIIYERPPVGKEQAVDLSGLENKWSLMSHENCVECGVNFEDNDLMPLRLWKNPDSDMCMEIALCWKCARPRMRI